MRLRTRIKRARNIVIEILRMDNSLFGAAHIHVISTVQRKAFENNLQLCNDFLKKWWHSNEELIEFTKKLRNINEVLLKYSRLVPDQFL